MENRVAIVGIGITSSLGHTLAEVTESLRNGRSRIVFADERKEKGFRSCLTAEIPPLEGKYKIDRRKRRFMSECATYSALTWLKTVQECGLNPDDFIGPDVGIVFGNDSSSQPLVELMDTINKYKETHFLGSNMVIKVMNSCCSMNLGPLIGAQGINITISAASASGAHAVGYAYSLIRSQLQRAIIVGAAQEMNWFSMVGLDAANIFSRASDPQRASRPFDHKRDGIVPGGGGAILVLENMQRALDKGHTIYGEIASYSFNSEGSHPFRPSSDKIAECMREALGQAQLSPDEIDCINPHGASTPLGDYLEAKAIHDVFGANGPPVSSTKSMSGHECWMAGVSELVYCLAMMQGGFIAPNVNFEQQEAEAPKININAEVLARKPAIILSNFIGLGGTNACIVVKSFIR